ncbi:F0F1-type ATP synthase assembly protein I [Lipingzhangella halophila]|uniref:F0F1-type ATP synthase assembly protein I n=1 Tax=Lipingzhangella halophila TaxID=1783352 RepID=A0A7W7RFM9_9ACTN|nr:hypothetical protein [Lipingzhangella halophila]MBB4931101.1 F0F1-type ATP synthase assembly protein I [Lipingzhangella halophila]
MAVPPAPDPAVLRPRKLWFWVGGLVIVLGIAGGITGFILGIAGVVNSTSTAAEFDAGEPATFEADEANTDSDTWKLYADQDISSRDAEENCEVTGPGGQVAISDPGYSSETTVNDERWVLVAQLDITETGEYTVECDASTNAGFSVGYGPGLGDNAMGIVGSIAALILVPLLGVIAGLTMIVVTAVRRSRHRTRLQAASGYGPGQYGPGQYGPPGDYGAPPGKI